MPTTHNHSKKPIEAKKDDQQIAMTALQEEISRLAAINIGLVNKCNDATTTLADLKKIVFSYIRWDSDKTNKDLIVAVEQLQREKDNRIGATTDRTISLVEENEKLWHLVRSLSGDDTLKSEIEDAENPDKPLKATPFNRRRMLNGGIGY
mgnify:CR=1 FL=1